MKSNNQNELDPQQVLGWINGTDDGIQRLPNNMPVKGSRWYIISNKWLNSWKSFVGLIPQKVNQEELPILNNHDIILQDPSILKFERQNYLKPGLRLSVDYQLVPPKAWNFFKSNYQTSQNPTIERFSIQLNDQGDTQVQINLKPVLLVVLNQIGRLQFDEPKIIFVSHKQNLLNFKQNLRKILAQAMKKPMIIEDRHIRMWKLDPENSLEDIKKVIPIRDQELAATFINQHQSIQEAQIADQDLVIIDIRDSSNFWSIRMPHSSSNSFMQNNRNIRNNLQISYQKSYSSNQGRTGLQNLGNTCFMNSGLQCLSNTPFLTQYFIQDHYQSEINRSNPLGTRGRLAQEYAMLVKQLWHSSSSFVSPWRFKNQLGLFARQFSGYQQHDSQEMLSFLLDGLHEDLNRVIDKPYNPELDLEGRTEEEMARMYWENHLSRNQSIIVDNMYGQYRSQVICPQCSKSSLAFDPFLMLTLPLPSKQNYGVDLTVVFSSLKESPLKTKLVLPRNAGYPLIKEEIRKIVGVHQGQIVLASVYSSNLQKILNEKEPFQKQRYLHAYFMEEISQKEKYVLVEHWKKSRYYSSNITPLAAPRFIKVPLDLPIQDIKEFIFRKYIQAFQDVTQQQHFNQLKARFLPSGENSNKQHLFNIKLANPQRKKYYQSNNSYKRDSCPFCNNLYCSSCEIPITEEPIQYLIEKSNGLLKLQVVWSADTPHNYITKISIPVTHDSHFQNSQILTNQKTQSVPLQACLQSFITPEILDANNTSYCGTCKQHVQGTKKMDIYKLPDTLIIHIKRFKQSGYFSTKNNRLVEFPIQGLDMSAFCLSEGGIYDLYAISNHYGSLGGGHYTAFAKNRGEWFHFDDSRVSKVREESQIISKAAYVLFYKKIN